MNVRKLSTAAWMHRSCETVLSIRRVKISYTCGFHRRKRRIILRVAHAEIFMVDKHAIIYGCADADFRERPIDFSY